MTDIIEKMGRITHSNLFKNVPGHNKGECIDCDEARESVMQDDRAKASILLREMMKEPTGDFMAILFGQPMVPQQRDVNLWRHWLAVFAKSHSINIEDE